MTRTPTIAPPPRIADRDDIMAMGDVGARHLIGQAPDLVCEVEMAESGVLLDVDTQQELAGFANR